MDMIQRLANKVRSALLRGKVQTARIGARTLLLPGVEGFASPTALTINPSYYAFPMLDEMAALAPSPRWTRRPRAFPCGPGLLPARPR